MANDRQGSGTGARQQTRVQNRRPWWNRTWASVATAALALPLVAIPAGPASAADLILSKTEVSSGPYGPGDTVQWVVTLSCSDPVEPCSTLAVSDPLPEGVELVSASIQSGPPDAVIDADLATDTVSYRASSVPNGQQAQIVVTGEVDPDLPYAANGTTLTNTARGSGGNTDLVEASDDIDLVVPIDLGSDTTKSIDPATAIASPGTPATITLGSTNTSNDAVDTLVIQDPVDPSQNPNPFTYLDYTGTGDVVYPPNADTLEEEYWDGSAWVELTPTTDPADVQGVRYTFSGDIQPGATATIPVEVEQNDAVTDLIDPTTVDNDASSFVTHSEGGTSDPTTADDTYAITPPNNSVAASKSFSPDTVSAGDPVTVTIGATNGGDATTSLTITEPSPGTPSPFEGDDALTFTGFGEAGDGTGVQWPADAEAATVTYQCASGAPAEESTTTVDTLPNPPDTCDVTGFTVEFTGDIVTGGAASIPFAVATDPDQTTRDVVHDNEITAQIPNAVDTADDTLITLTDRLATETDKTISPSEFPSIPGQSVIVQLPSQLLPFGPDGSTTDANDVVIQDPTDPSSSSEFWSHFEAASVRSTDVPAGATMTVSYWDGTQWVVATDCGEGGTFTGPTTASCTLPEGAQGVQFSYHSDDGFPPGTSFQPNFAADFTGPEGLDDPVTNCGSSTAASDAVTPSAPAEGCAEVDPFPVSGGGDFNFINKNFLGEDPATVRARTQDRITARLTWSTNGFVGVDQMVVADIADPETTAIENSFYDAFDLVRVQAIDDTRDPLMQYDAVTGAQLYIGGAWIDATNDPCSASAPCEGSFPGFALTAAEREGATSVRLTYIEGANRDTSDPTLPQPGDGVARSTLADGRHLDLLFELRDTRRGSGDPVLGSTQGTVYNRADDPGLVRDTARATASFDGEDYTDTDFDEVLILDQPINIGFTKDWSGGPLSVPPEGTPTVAYPSTDVVLTATNNSVARVDSMRIAEPSTASLDGSVEVDPGGTPFDVFTLTGLEVDPPEGTDADGTTVTLTSWNGGSPTTATYTEAEAEALPPADLADVVGVEAQFDGRIDSEAEGTLDLRLKLREFDRYDPATRTNVADYSPVPNSAGAELDDAGGTPDSQTPEAWDDAEMILRDANISMDLSKSFDPDSIVEPGSEAEENPTTTLVLGAGPTGPSRAVSMTVTDVDGSFWNQYDLVGLDSSVLRNPINQVQVDAYTGGTYDPTQDEFVGGTWTDGTPGTGFGLPGAVAAADVVGLRFTFTRDDGQIWENPANPLQQVRIDVQVRDTLRSDPATPVPSTLDQNPAAPGEVEPGEGTNTATSTVTGADLVVNPADPTGDLVPVSAEDDAIDVIVYEHTENGVKIVKDFAGDISGGTKPPDGVFPMNIAVTNTGNRPIGGLVINDVPMPVDSGGAQLELVTEREDITYTLSGAAPDPANGAPLPTTEAGTSSDVDADITGNILGLRFRFPDDAVLEVGQTYTISVPVKFRVGVEPSVAITNSAGVVGDRPWDTCDSYLEPLPDGVTDTSAQRCMADADVAPIPAAVISQQKFVKATNDDELAVIVDPDFTGDPIDPADCAPNVFGFYAYPCTPVIAPGHDQTWRIRVNNVGNLPMNKLVSYDRLPTPGDTGSFASGARGSAWGPLMNRSAPPELVNAPAGTVATFSYATTQDYCMDDINDPLNEPICPTDDAEAGWIPLTGSETDEIYEQITAFKTVLTFPEGNLFEPGDFVALEGTTTTPATAPDAGDRSIAWNSAAVSGVAVTPNLGEVDLLPTEGTKVGVATATGPLEVRKNVIGPGSAYAPDEFELTVQCTSAVGSWVEEELDPIPVTVPRGGSTTVENLPYGARCHVEEGDNGQSLMISSEVTIGESPDVTTVTATNLYRLAGLELAKVVDTDAVDQDGEPIPYGPFEATVECTFLGEAVYADGYGADAPLVVTLDDGGDPVQLTGLPAGAECTITETDTAGADETTMAVSQDGALPVVTTGPTTTVVLDPNTVVGATITNSVDITNTFDVGSLQIEKVVDGDAAEWGDGPFEVEVTCTLDDTGGDPRVVYSDIVILGGGQPLEATIANLPNGAECAVVETEDGGATSVSVSPDSVTVAAGETVELVVTNTFDTGSVVVDKALDGVGAPFATGPFEVTLACTFEGEEIEIPGGPTREFGPDAPAQYDGLPVGAECVVTETLDGGATEVEISTSVDGGDPGEVVVVDGADAEVTVTNTFRISPLVVRKAVDGDAAEFGTGPFEVELTCTFGGMPISIPFGAVREIAPGGFAAYFGLPDGAECAVTETDDGGATSTTVEPASIVVNEDELVTIDVTNTFDAGSILVDKELTGIGALYVTDPFEVTLQCEFNGEPIDIPGGAVRTLTPEEPVEYDGLPVGADCIVTETDAGFATGTEISTTVDGGEPGEVIVSGGDAVEITVTNRFEISPVVVRKEVDGDGAAFGTGPFEVTLACTYEGREIEIPRGSSRQIEAGGLAVYFGLPDGAECGLTESDDGGATSSSVSPESVVISEETLAEFTVTNTFDVGDLAVEKIVAGDGAELYGDGPFEVTLSCEFNGSPIEVPGGAEREIDAGTPVLYEGLPVGAECGVVESATGGATVTTVAPEDGVLVVGSEETGTFTVTNAFGLGDVVVTKTLSGSGADEHADDTFVVTLSCTQDVDGEAVEVPIPGGAEREISAEVDWTVRYADLPQGSTCSLAESDAGDAVSVDITVGDETVPTDPTADDPTSGSFVVPVAEADDGALPATEIAVGVDNAFDATPTPPVEPPDGGLPSTGAAVTGAVLIALLLVGLGVGLVVVRRRRN